MSSRWFMDSFFPTYSQAIFSAFEEDFFNFDRRLHSIWNRASSAVAPRFGAYDGGAEWVVRADVPGLSEKDLEITAQNGTVTIRGERKLEPMDGYTVRIQERSPMKFSQSISLGNDVDLSRAEASIENGVLNLRIPKTPEAQPRRIPVKAS